ncbi:hypothetical protein HMPREF1552_00691 [Leptotrichia sp. oral taxon 879 str. F0557]|nr:hypothetical protein HMPREF1552_00691 [Leptotrichia sp. oral taxon 879 str. F0557]
MITLRNPKYNEVFKIVEFFYPIRFYLVIFSFYKFIIYEVQKK